MKTVLYALQYNGILHECWVMCIINVSTFCIYGGEVIVHSRRGLGARCLLYKAGDENRTRELRCDYPKCGKRDH